MKSPFWSGSSIFHSWKHYSESHSGWLKRLLSPLSGAQSRKKHCSRFRLFHTTHTTLTPRGYQNDVERKNVIWGFWQITKQIPRVLGLSHGRSKELYNSHKTTEGMLLDPERSGAHSDQDPRIAHQKLRVSCQPTKSGSWLYPAQALIRQKISPESCISRLTDSTAVVPGVFLPQLPPGAMRGGNLDLSSWIFDPHVSLTLNLSLP